MRTQLFVLLAGSLLAACGGDDNGTTMPDAKVYKDAAIDSPPACAVMGPLGMLGFGSSTMRASGDFFQMPTSGPLMGKTIFFIGAGLPGSTATSADVLAFSIVKSTTGSGFVTGTAENFSTDPTMQTATYQASVYGDYNSQTKSAAQILWASSGSITLSKIGETDGSQIDGTVSATNYRQIDQMTGADTPGGCTLALAGMSFALVQKAAPATSENPASEAWQPSPEDLAAMASQYGKLTQLRGE
jgi:hypothetical protein